MNSQKMLIKLSNAELNETFNKEKSYLKSMKQFIELKNEMTQLKKSTKKLHK